MVTKEKISSIKFWAGHLLLSFERMESDGEIQNQSENSDKTACVHHHFTIFAVLTVNTVICNAISAYWRFLTELGISHVRLEVLYNLT